MRNRRVQGQLTAILCAIVVPSFGRVHVGQVALVGHSLGSLVAIQESATDGDVDGVALTGISHNVTPVLGEAAAASGAGALPA